MSLSNISYSNMFTQALKLALLIGLSTNPLTWVYVTQPSAESIICETIALEARTIGSADVVVFYIAHAGDAEQTYDVIAQDVYGGDTWSTAWNTQALSDGVYTVVAFAAAASNPDGIFSEPVFFTVNRDYCVRLP